MEFHLTSSHHLTSSSFCPEVSFSSSSHPFFFFFFFFFFFLQDAPRLEKNGNEGMFTLGGAAEPDPAKIEFEIDPVHKILDIVHTYTPERLRGKGLAAVLAERCFSYAEEQGLKVRPSCTYISGTFLAKFPKYLSMIAK